MAVLCLGMLLPVVSCAASAVSGETLSLREAERIALAADPAILATRSKAAALEERAVADGQLPDPKLGIGVYNLPLDDFSFSSQPTTQFRTKIQQAFPPGDTLHYRQAQTEWLARAERARTRLAALEIQRDVRLSFLELYYQQQAARIIEQSRGLFQQLVDTTRSHFATGRVSQQDVLEAHLELSRLDDRLSRIAEKADVERARLSRWLGDDADRTIDSAFPRLMPIPSRAALERSLLQHPAIVTLNARVESHQQMVKAAREQYKPGWNVGVEYRKRFGEDPDGSDRADMMAAMLTVDLPLFTEKRQDRRLAASQQNAEAARQMRERKLRELRQFLNADYARWQRLGDQEELYRTRLVREAIDNVEAALLAYQSGTNDFTSLMRARILELDTRLQDVRVRVDREKTHSRLLFLTPGTLDTTLFDGGNSE